MLEPDFVAMLRCVESGSELLLLERGKLDVLNEAITNGKVTTQVGHQLDRPLEAALVNSDASWAYQVLDGIPVLLAEQAIAYQQHLGGANS